MAHPRHFRPVNETGWDLPQSKLELNAESLRTSLRLKITPYVESLGYKPPDKINTQAFWKQMRLKASQMDIHCPKNSPSYECFKAGGSYAIV
jgi:hypothetical protein